MPKFEAGTTYRFAVLNWRGKAHQQRNGFKRVYLRHVGKLELFKSPAAGWLESFTRAQLADFQITEVQA